MSNAVMVVDDDVSVLFTVQTVLETEGFDVKAVLGGGDCLRELRQGWRGLIFMDIMMPQMDGWDTIQAIHDEGMMEGNTICVLSALSAPGAKVDDLGRCIRQFISKPFEPHDLAQTARSILRDGAMAG